MSRTSAYRAICDRCGFKYFDYQLKKEWTGLMVCHGPDTNDCWEMRHPQDFLRGRREAFALPWTRPEPADVDAYTICTMEGRHSYADFGTADCMIAGYTVYSPNDLLIQFVCSVEGRYGGADYAEADCAEA